MSPNMLQRLLKDLISNRNQSFVSLYKNRSFKNILGVIAKVCEKSLCRILSIIKVAQINAAQQFDFSFRFNFHPHNIISVKRIGEIYYKSSTRECRTTKLSFLFVSIFILIILLVPKELMKFICYNYNSCESNFY